LDRILGVLPIAQDPIAAIQDHILILGNQFRKPLFFPGVEEATQALAIIRFHSAPRAIVRHHSAI
jgi:hypothetical protein